MGDTVRIIGIVQNHQFNFDDYSSFTELSSEKIILFNIFGKLILKTDLFSTLHFNENDVAYFLRSSTY